MVKLAKSRGMIQLDPGIMRAILEGDRSQINARRRMTAVLYVARALVLLSLVAAVSWLAMRS